MDSRVPPHPRAGGRSSRTHRVLCLAVLAFALGPRAALADAAEATSPAPRRHPGRAAAETTAVLLGGTVWYWRSLDFNTRDWDLRWDWPSWRRKLLSLDAVRFDQNEFDTNAIDHARAGTAYYEIARGNGLSAGSAFLLSFGASVVWEYGVEFKEMVSLNDVILTPTAGIAIGEPLHQLGLFFLRGKPNPVNNALAGLFSPVSAMNRWVDGASPRPDVTDALGFSREVWHRFAMGAGYGTATFPDDIARSETILSASSELVMLPGYGLSGSFSRRVPVGAWSALEGDLWLGDVGVTGGTMRTRTLLGGWYRQRMRRDGLGQIEGTGSLLGLGSGFEYYTWARPDGRDRLANVGILGPVVELQARLRALRVRWATEGYWSFALVQAAALEGRMPRPAGDVYRPGQVPNGTKGSLGLHGYYFGQGVTTQSRLSVDAWGWDAGAEGRADHWSSIEGHDRFQEEIADDFELRDWRVTGRLSLGVRPWGAWLRAGAFLDWSWRDSTAQGFRRTWLDRRAGARLSVVF